METVETVETVDLNHYECLLSEVIYHNQPRFDHFLNLFLATNIYWVHLLDVEISKFVTSKSFCQRHSFVFISILSSSPRVNRKQEPICTNAKYEIWTVNISPLNIDYKYFSSKYGLQIFLFWKKMVNISLLNTDYKNFSSERRW